MTRNLKPPKTKGLWKGLSESNPDFQGLRQSSKVYRREFILWRMKACHNVNGICSNDSCELSNFWRDLSTPATYPHHPKLVSHSVQHGCDSKPPSNDLMKQDTSSSSSSSWSSSSPSSSTTSSLSSSASSSSSSSSSPTPSPPSPSSLSSSHKKKQLTVHVQSLGQRIL